MTTIIINEKDPTMWEVVKKMVRKSVEFIVGGVAIAAMAYFAITVVIAGITMAFQVAPAFFLLMAAAGISYVVLKPKTK